MSNLKSLSATVLEIQRMSTEDGPGLRTSVFFKGCTLACAWCHNPESISIKPQIQWIETKCIGCMTCINACPEKALSMKKFGIVIDRDKCQGCGTCSDECPTLAMEMLGTKWQLDDLINEVVKDRAYFENSGGGITVTGGEPALQKDFVHEFLKTCKNKDLNTALDTCGMIPRESLEILLPYADTVLFDIKVMDSDLHRKFTAQYNEKILANLIFVAEYIRNHDKKPVLWIRTPLIPDATATEDNITEIASFLNKNIPDVVERWELCSFNNLCRDKYRRLGLEWIFKDTNLLTKEFLEDITNIAKKSVDFPDKVIWTGATRVDKDELIDEPSSIKTPKSFC